MLWWLFQAREIIDIMPEYKSETIKLPEHVQDSNTSIEEALLKRRSGRSYQDSSLSLDEVSQPGAFYDDAGKKVLQMHDSEQPLYIRPVERIR